MARKRVKRKKKNTNVSSLILNGVIGALVVVIILFIYSIYDGHLRVEANMAAYTGENLEDIPTAILTSQENRQKEMDMIVQILNGCGVNGISKKFKDILSNKGIDIINTENADNFNYANSLIHFHGNNVDKAFKLADILGIDKSLIFEKPENSIRSDLTLILGRDYDQLSEFNIEKAEITVQLLNGNGIRGVSKRYRNYFSQQGYRVVDVDNAENFNYSHSEIHYNNVNQNDVNELSDLLGIKGTNIKKTSRLKKADISIILGSDYQDLKPYRNLEVR